MSQVPESFRKAVAREIYVQQHQKPAQCTFIAEKLVVNCHQCQAFSGHYCTAFVQGLVDENGIKQEKRIIREGC